MPEIKTLSTPHNTYDSFPDKTARAQLGNVERLATETKESSVEAINEIVYKAPLFIRIIEESGGTHKVDKTATEIATAIDEKKPIFLVLVRNGTPITMPSTELFPRDTSGERSGKISFVSFFNETAREPDTVDLTALTAEIEYSLDDGSIYFGTFEQKFTKDFTIPVFNLLSLPAVPLSGGFSSMEVDTTEIRAALDKGAVEFVIPFGNDGNKMPANITMNRAKLYGSYQCISIVNYTTPGTVTVNITDTMIQVVYAPLGDVPAATIDMSGFESEGKIVETFADGSTETTVMEFDAEGKPTKITDGNGNVTVLTW